MKKILIFASLVFLNITTQAQENIDEVMESYVNEIIFKQERINEINNEILKLAGRQKDPKIQEQWKTLNCQRRASIRDYIQTLNQVSKSKEISSIEDSEEMKETINQMKNKYLIEMAQEDEMLQQSMVGQENNTSGFEGLTIDWLCKK